MRSIAIGLLLSSLIAAPALADVKAGVDAWSRGDYPAAIKEWRPLAIKGDADAQFNLGTAYAMGRAVEYDLKQAEEWYRKAALQGHEGAEAAYGLAMFQNGKRPEAIPWLEKAVSRGDRRAQYILGVALFNGDAVEKDWVRAYALVTRASASGLPNASTALAQMDRTIPLDQRQRGLALARDMELAASKPMLAPAQTAPQAPVRRPASPIEPVRTVDLPPAEQVPQRPLTAADLGMTNKGDDLGGPVARPIPAPRPVAPKSTPAPRVVAPKPTPTPAPRAVSAATSRRGWRVQLGAFGEESRARALFGQLEAQVPALSDLQPYLVKAGSVTRLQVGPLGSSAAAERLCSQVRAKGNACVTVAP